MTAITSKQKVLMSLTSPIYLDKLPYLKIIPEWVVTSGDVILEVFQDGLSAFAILGKKDFTSIISVTAIVNDSNLLLDTFQVCVVSEKPKKLIFTRQEPVLK